VRNANLNEEQRARRKGDAEWFDSRTQFNHVATFNSPRSINATSYYITARNLGIALRFMVHLRVLRVRQKRRVRNENTVVRVAAYLHIYSPERAR